MPHSVSRIRTKCNINFGHKLHFANDTAIIKIEIEVKVRMKLLFSKIKSETVIHFAG